MKFGLDINNVKLLPFSKYEKNFTFIFQGRNYQTSRLIADILSPIIRNYHFSDETIDKFYINSNFKSNKKFDFNEIVNLTNFELNDLDDDQIQFYREIFLALGNSEVYLNLVPELNEEINLKNVFNRIDLKMEYVKIAQNEIENDIAGLFENEIDFIAVHFHELNRSKLLSLDDNILSSILKSEKLQLEDEDSFFDFIVQRYQHNKDETYLFEFIEFFNISVEKIEQFFNSLPFDDVNQDIWKILTRYIVKTHKAIQEKEMPVLLHETDPFLHFPYHDANSMDGIIRYLTNKTKGNIHDNNTIDITSNGYCGSHSPKFLLNFDGSRIYHSNREINNWICYDFKDKKIKISDYSIESVNWDSNEHYLRSWIIEVSNDGSDWTTIDSQENSVKLNGSGRIGTFKVNENEFSRYVRLRQTGPDWKNEDLMILKSIEFYGNLMITSN